MAKIELKAQGKTREEAFGINVDDILSIVGELQ
jgi:hypothetical protein